MGQPAATQLWILGNRDLFKLFRERKDLFNLFSLEKTFFLPTCGAMISPLIYVLKVMSGYYDGQ